VISGNEIGADVLSLFESEASAPDLAEFLEFVRKHYRLETLSYVWPARSIWLIKNPCLAIAFSDAWLDHCSAKGLATARDALDWSFISRLEAAIDMARIESQFSVASSRIIVPLRGSRGSLDALIVVTLKGPEENWSRRRLALGRDLTNVAHYIHRRSDVLWAGGRDEEREPLTMQETEVLGLLAEGLDAANIGRAMRVDESVARCWLDSARYKVGALTLTQATARALREGLI
jgi:hypothetical protein